MDRTPNEVTHLIDRLRAGDRRALGELFDRYRDRLRRMVELRMDPRLRARLDASDVLQEAYPELAGDLDAYRADPKLQPLLWMRLHVGRRGQFAQMNFTSSQFLGHAAAGAQPGNGDRMT